MLSVSYVLQVLHTRKEYASLKISLFFQEFYTVFVQLMICVIITDVCVCTGMNKSHENEMNIL